MKFTMATRRDKRNEGNLRRNRHADSRRNASAFSAGVLTQRRTGIPSSQRSAHCCLWRTNPFSRASPVADVDAATVASLDGRLWSAYCCFRRVYLSSRVVGGFAETAPLLPLGFTLQLTLCTVGKRNHVPTPQCHCKRGGRQWRRVVGNTREGFFSCL